MPMQIAQVAERWFDCDDTAIRPDQDRSEERVETCMSSDIVDDISRPYHALEQFTLPILVAA
jgi:hypothetical protein